MAFSVVQHQISGTLGTSDSAGNTGSLVWGSTPTNGNLMCVALTFRGNATVTGPAGWTRVGTGVTNGTTCQTEIWYRVASGESTTGPAFVISATTSFLLAQAEISGWAGTPTLDSSGTNSGSAVSTLTVTGSTGQASDLVFGACGNAEGNTASVVFNASTAAGGATLGADIDAFNPAKNGEGLRDTWATAGGSGTSPSITFNTSSSSNTKLAAILATFKDVAGAAVNTGGVVPAPAFQPSLFLPAFARQLSFASQQRLIGFAATAWPVAASGSSTSSGSADLTLVAAQAPIAQPPAPAFQPSLFLPAFARQLAFSSQQRLIGFAATAWPVAASGSSTSSGSADLTLVAAQTPIAQPPAPAFQPSLFLPAFARQLAFASQQRLAITSPQVMPIGEAATSTSSGSLDVTVILQNTGGQAPQPSFQPSLFLPAFARQLAFASQQRGAITGPQVMPISESAVSTSSGSAALTLIPYTWTSQPPAPSFQPSFFVPAFARQLAFSSQQRYAVAAYGPVTWSIGESGTSTSSGSLDVTLVLQNTGGQAPQPAFQPSLFLPAFARQLAFASQQRLAITSPQVMPIGEAGASTSSGSADLTLIAALPFSMGWPPQTIQVSHGWSPAFARQLAFSSQQRYAVGTPTVPFRVIAVTVGPPFVLWVTGIPIAAWETDEPAHEAWRAGSATAADWKSGPVSVEWAPDAAKVR